MRGAGLRGVLIHCTDYHCSHSLLLCADRWPDEVTLSEITGITSPKCSGPRAFQKMHRYGRAKPGQIATCNLDQA